jgi:hypothetical protein
VGIAGPGDALTSSAAFETFMTVHEAYPDLILCLATNGLMLLDCVEELLYAGIRTITVTVNAVVDMPIIVGSSTWIKKRECCLCNDIICLSPCIYSIHKMKII